jgi:hypothetical protein
MMSIGALWMMSIGVVMIGASKSASWRRSADGRLKPRWRR